MIILTDEEHIYYLIGQNIRYYRKLYNLNKSKDKELTQEKLAELAGVSVSLIGNLESDKVSQGVSVYNLWKISNILNVPIQKFFAEIKN